MSLSARVVAQDHLSDAERDRMLALMEACYDGVDAHRFRTDLAAKPLVIVMRDVDGAIQGFSTLMLMEERLDGRVVDVVFSGDTVIDPAHWGSKALQLAFGTFCLQRKLKHPRRALYWLLLSKGFRTYLLAVNYFPRTFPKPDATPTTAQVAFRDHLATKLWGDAYDPQRQILSFGGARDRVKTPMAPPSAEALESEAVRFFLALNPEHERGDELVCLVHLPLRDLGRALVRASAKAVQAVVRPRRRRRQRPTSPPPNTASKERLA